MLIELGKRGYRSGEPDGIEREVSTVLAKVLAALWSKGMTKDDIAKDLEIPLEEIEALIFRLSPDQGAVIEVHKPSLRLVK